MNNDETLFKQAGLLTGLASAGDDLRAALKIQSAPMAATAVKKVFDAVDALRETIRTDEHTRKCQRIINVRSFALPCVSKKPFTAPLLKWKEPSPRVMPTWRSHGRKLIRHFIADFELADLRPRP